MGLALSRYLDSRAWSSVVPSSVLSTSVSESPNASSQFFKLPLEIRNTIYRLVLIESHNIDLAETGVPEPGLLETCRRVRAEAKGIFYLENTFNVSFNEYDPTQILRVIARKHQVGKLPKSHFATDFKPKWTNLVRWLWLCHRREVMRGVPSPDHANWLAQPVNTVPSMAPRVVGAMFTVMESMRKRPWEEVQAALTPLYYVLITADKDWAAKGDGIWASIEQQG